MKSIYSQLTIGDVCDVGDGAHAKVSRVDRGIPYLTSKNIGNGSLKLTDVDYISLEDFERLFSENSKAITRLQPGDLLTGIIGTFGNVYEYKENDLFGISSAVALSWFKWRTATKVSSAISLLTYSHLAFSSYDTL